jgi:hypothetical protein
MLEKLKELLKKANENGIYLPMVRDPKTGAGSVSLTLVVMSFTACIVGLIGKWSGYLGGIDMTQALNLFMVCAGLYWGRKLGSSKDGIKSEPVESTSKE